MVSSGISPSVSMSQVKDNQFNQTSKTENGSLDFSQLMTRTVRNTVTKPQNTELKSDSRTDSVKAQGTDSKIGSGADAETTSKTEQKTATGVNKPKVDKNSADTDNTKDIRKMNVSDEKAETKVEDAPVAGAEQILAGIISQLKDKFGVSDEDLENALANLGLTAQDLLQTGNLTDLVCEITGTENALTLLTDSSLSQNLKSLIDFVNTNVSELAQEMDITPEELKAMIQESISGQKEQDFKVEQPISENTETIIKVSEKVAETVTDESGKVQNIQTETETDIDLVKEIIQGKLEETSKDTGSGSDSMKKDNSAGRNPEQQLSDIASKLSQSIQTSFAGAIADEAVKVEPADVIRQIVEAAKVTASEGISSMELQLNPHNLGKINLTVIAKDGMITAQITAESEAVKKALENQMHVLKESFANQGIKVDAVEVTIASHAFESGRNQSEDESQQGSGKKKRTGTINTDSLEDLQESDLSDEEKRIMQLLKSNNNSVEYSA